MDAFLLNQEERSYLGYPLLDDNMNQGIAQTSKPKTYYLDCEMVETINGQNVVKIAFGNHEESTVMWIKPTDEVTDYITEITGVNENTEYQYSFDEAIKLFSETISPNDILVGHHMYHDLRVLNFYHENVIDTCMIFHHPDGPPTYYALKYLAQVHLLREIQTSIHDPREDGLAAYDLVRFCINNGYVKTIWAHINEVFIPTLELILKALRLQEEQLYALYARGSRAVGTNRDNSDYDYVAVCDDGCKIVNGTLVRYGNLDICVYLKSDFDNYLKEQIIWILEALYCPRELILHEKINFAQQVEQYRSKHKTQSDINLLNSVGREAGRKVGAAKRQYLAGNYYQSKKYLFIAIRFIELATQITKLGKITDLRCSNHHWEIIKNLPINLTFKEYKTLWSSIYQTAYRNLSKSTVKLSKNVSHEGCKRSSKTRLVQDEVINYSDLNLNEVVQQLQQYLRSHTLDDLYQQYLISSFTSNENPSLVLLRYDSHKAPMSTFRHICRGLIIDSEDDWKIISYPFNNFIQDKSYTRKDLIVEKIDGSFCQLYYYNDRWRVSSSRNSDGTTKIGVRRQLSIIFRDLFWSIFNRKYANIILDPNCTYMFEMISPSHPIIVCYDVDDLYLIGVRNCVTYQEYNIYDERFELFDKPLIHNVVDVENMDTNMSEGVVVITPHFNRIKYKTKTYVKKSYKFPLCINRHTTSIVLAIIKVLQSGEKDEFIKYCPDFTDQLLNIENNINSLKSKVIEIYDEQNQHITDRKMFAFAVEHFPKYIRKYLFSLYNGHDLNIFVSNIKHKRLYKDLSLFGSGSMLNIVAIKNNPEAMDKPKDIELWKQYQVDGAKKIIKEDMFGENLRYVGGLDISFDKDNTTRACTYLTVYDLVDKKVVHECYDVSSIDVPYISGLLGFREVPQYIKLLESIKYNQYYPQMLIVDGCGILHHRACGSASHLGLELDMPTIGIGKSLIHIHGLDEKVVKSQFKNECKHKGDYMELIGDDGVIYGAAIKSVENGTNPLYVSIGHKISLKSAIRITLEMCQYRIPEPIRNSDIKSKLHL